MPNGVYAPKPLLPLSTVQSGNYGSKRKGRRSQMVIRLVLFATVSLVAAYSIFAVVFLRKATDATLEVAPARGDVVHYLEETDQSQPSRTLQKQYQQHNRQALAQKEAAGGAHDQAASGDQASRFSGKAQRLHEATADFQRLRRQQRGSHDSFLDPAVTLYSHHDRQQAEQQQQAVQGSMPHSVAGHTDPLKDLGITQKAFNDVVAELDSKHTQDLHSKEHTVSTGSQTIQQVAQQTTQPSLGYEEAHHSPTAHEPGQPDSEITHQHGSTTGSVLTQQTQQTQQQGHDEAHTAASPAVAVPAHTVEPEAQHSSPAHAPQTLSTNEGSKPAGLYALQARDIHGVEQPLSQYAGNVTLVVNVASACGYTDSNYKGLQGTYEKYQKFGFTVLAFPCNQFGAQEPGSESDIQAFCSQRYHVTFPVFSKVDVNGPNTHAVFKFLKQHLPESEGGGGGTGAGQDIGWNFYKFLVDHTGQPIRRWDSHYNVAAVEHEVYDALLAKNAATATS